MGRNAIILRYILLDRSKSAIPEVRGGFEQQYCGRSSTGVRNVQNESETWKERGVLLEWRAFISGYRQRHHHSMTKEEARQREAIVVVSFHSKLVISDGTFYGPPERHSKQGGQREISFTFGLIATKLLGTFSSIRRPSLCSNTVVVVAAAATHSFRERSIHPWGAPSCEYGLPIHRIHSTASSQRAFTAGTQTQTHTHSSSHSIHPSIYLSTDAPPLAIPSRHT
uniref:Uncharacterized protein n=1 Tax=Setaria digitata TaxID=48799 RepID=A0A915PQS9_9BILA